LPAENEQAVQEKNVSYSPLTYNREVEMMMVWLQILVLSLKPNP
jgi:hypothetical protein